MEPIKLASLIETAVRSQFATMRVSDFHKHSPTKLVMEFFGRLGKLNGFLVAADTYGIGCEHADQGSWLYDMAWWSVDSAKMLSRLDFVLESEMKPGGNVLNAGDVDSDFQKLVQARAGVRVWLSLVPNTATAARHVEIVNSKYPPLKQPSEAIYTFLLLAIGLPVAS